MVQRRISKDELVEQLRGIKARGWIESVRAGSAGGIGNTIEQLLGYPDNNLPVADTAQWEIKSHRKGSSNLLTLLHREPHPRSAKIVPRVLLPKYGWPDAKGREGESSFRQTIRATQWSERGFRIRADRDVRQIQVEFNSTEVNASHYAWLRTVENHVGLGPLEPQPYWPIQELELVVSTKMLNSVFIQVDSERRQRKEWFSIDSVQTLQGFDIDGFISGIETGDIYVDFDARTSHNHGTKFRMKHELLPLLYRYVEEVI